MKTNFTLFFVILFIFCCTEKKKNGLLEYRLTTPGNNPVSFSEINKQKATVFIFLKPDCPLSQNYTLTLNNLCTDFAKDNIRFVGVIPCCVSNSEASDFISRYKILFPVVMDQKNEIVNFFKATCTPEVFVIDKSETVLYKGAIDDWAISIGKHRTVITKNYLYDALMQIKNNLAVGIEETQAVGCVIEKLN